MKSQTLSNLLLLVIAVGTLGNFFQGQAVRSPAAALGETAVKVRNTGDLEAIPVRLLGYSLFPGDGLPTRNPVLPSQMDPDHRITAFYDYLRDLSPASADPLLGPAYAAMLEADVSRLVTLGFLTRSEGDAVLERYNRLKAAIETIKGR